MQTAQQTAPVSVSDYLQGEESSEVRHEFVAGAVYAMSGGSTEHNAISGNIYVALRAHLRGRTCRAFMADIKVHLRIAGEDIFYYPDVMVTCDPRDTGRFAMQFPAVLIEVLSDTTERTDRREKFLSYTQMESLAEYVLVAQDRCEVTVFRRTTAWKPEVLRGAGQSLRLDSLEFEMPLAAIYEGVKL